MPNPPNGSPQLPGEAATAPTPITPPPKLDTAAPPAVPISSAKGKPTFVTKDELMHMLGQSVAKGVSDIHLRMGHRPKVRLNGSIQTLNMPYVSDKSIYDLLQATIPFRTLDKIDHLKEIDYGFELPGIARFRVNLFHEMANPAMVLRLIPLEIPSLESLGLPDILDRFCHLQNGLVLVTGATGSGKSTTLAAMLSRINQLYKKHIITVEDPVEFIHKHQQSIVTQRELGSDTDNFASGVKYALRQDPDVVLIGEIRDGETAKAALIAAETGHLVFSTLHTSDAVQTINRIINIFNPKFREPVRMQLAEAIRGTIAMKLLSNKAGDGRTAVCEVVTATSTVKDYIQRNQTDQIYELLDTTDLGEMVSFNRSLFNAVKDDMITPEVAIQHSNNPVALRQRLKGVFHGTL